MAADLFRLAVTAMAKAHAPYSGFRVGAAIRTRDGRTYSGCNIENAAFPEGWCAETTAIGQMVMDGGGSIDEVCVVSDGADSVTPCGGCRQRIAEFGDVDTRILLCDQKGIVSTHTLAELLPSSFSLGRGK